MQTITTMSRRGARAILLACAFTGGASAATPPAPGLGPNVLVFTPAMPLSQIQAAVNAVAAQQVGNMFGTQRTALLFAPGTYGNSAAPLNFQVGYYTSVAGLGNKPGDVVINGSVDVYNQCDGANCQATTNFWRSLSNLTINVNNSNFGCHAGEFWAVSQQAPIRRVQVNGLTTFDDYCSNPSFASGGFVADSVFAGPKIVNGSQQQFLVRNSDISAAGWGGGVWNQVFSGVIGAPATCFAQPSCGPYTTLPRSPVTREAPYLSLDASGNYQVAVPTVQSATLGATWQAGGSAPARILPLSSFFVATPANSAATINAALAAGHNVLLTPGVYSLSGPLIVKRTDAVLLGVGFPTLVPSAGTAAIVVGNVTGVVLSGMIVDAGPKHSAVLVQVGGSGAGATGLASDPSAVFDLTLRIGGATLGTATTALVVNSDHTILDDVWAWRADHGPSGTGWAVNTADTGLSVLGADVTAYGLAVEHFQKYEVIWNGAGGTDIFFQNEMPYDPPSQAAWMESPSAPGYPAFRLNRTATGFAGYGMGSYSFFNQGVNIVAARAFEVAAPLNTVSLHDLLTVFLSTAGAGGILKVVNTTGGSSTAANPDVAVPVVSFP